jgi:23S rRNA (guanosine2251-2'-O)-methyltransferase
VSRPAAGRPRAVRGRRRLAAAADADSAARSGQPERLIGVHPVQEALRARRRRLRRLLLRRGAGGALREELLALARLAEAAGVPVEEIAAADFERIAPPGLPHQGVLLEAGPVPDLALDDLVPGPEEGAWLVALDGVEDPQNLGAILRVADAAGARGALLPERRAAPLSPAVARASAGALEHLPVARVGNLARALHLLKERGFWVHGAAPDAPLDLYETPDRLFDRRLVLVVGAEGRGLRSGVRAAVDTLYRIPMQGRVASLNVATAAAVVLFEWARRARPHAPPHGSGGDA